MIDEVTGVRRIRMLYVQLHYRCNYTCQHCFHGELLSSPERYTRGEVRQLLEYFVQRYQLEEVTFLGGEPLLHPDIVAICADAKKFGLRTEICTNGHAGFHTTVKALVPYLDRLRVSLEGLSASNDRIRQRGSFASAMQTIQLARQLDLEVGVTMTVTAVNIDEVAPLARVLAQYGVQQLKLHHLRPIGNAAHHPELLVHDDTRYTRLRDAIEDAELGVEVIYDADLAPHAPTAACEQRPDRGNQIDRIELDPRGALTMSCKAVGCHAHAFEWNTARGTVVYRPHDDDELQRQIPDVNYQTA